VTPELSLEELFGRNHDRLINVIQGGIVMAIKDHGPSIEKRKSQPSQATPRPPEKTAGCGADMKKKHKMDKLSIAQAIRKELEKRAYGWKSNAEELDCLCGIASLALAAAFQHFGHKAEVKASMIGGIDHCFVISDDEIWDLTIKQFEKWRPKIFVGSVETDDFGHLDELTNNDPKTWDWPLDHNKATNEIVGSAFGIAA
jgi:hypothetical protein